MTRPIRFLFVCAMSFSALLSPCRPASGGPTLLLDDFEDSSSLQRWQGAISLSMEYPAHGAKCLELDLSDRRAGALESEKLPADWSAYELLRFDIYNPSSRVQVGRIQILDSLGTDEEAEISGKSYRGDKIFLNRGWNHFEFKLPTAMVEDGDRHLALNKIRRFSLSFGRLGGKLYLDNFRLTRGEEPSAGASRCAPLDCRVVIDDRYASLQLYGPEEAIQWSPDIKVLRLRSAEAVKRLKSVVAQAEKAGLQPLYHRLPLETAKIGLEQRSKLVWFRSEAEETKILDYVVSSCSRAAEELAALLTRPPKENSSDPAEQAAWNLLHVPPYPNFKGLGQSDGFFRYPNGDPVIVLAMHGVHGGSLLDYFAPYDHVMETYCVGGGSRYDIERSPVYTAFHKYPDTHRVGWDGWCGHLIKDRWSMGGPKENVVICLESPQIREAVQEYIRDESKVWMSRPDLLYNIMGYELMYICYCDRSQEMFRGWLREKYQSIGRVNEIWGTKYTLFSDIAAPATQNAAPVADVNRAAWYDWACFNSRRFTDYLKWVKAEMRKYDPVTPINAGGTSSMLSAANSTTGIDEEMIINEVDDAILNESGGTHIFSDLFLSLSEKRKVMVEPEMGGGVHNILLHFIHGKSSIAKWLWGASRGSSEFPEYYATAVSQSWDIPLSEVAEVLRLGLDVRRLGPEIAEFTRPEPELALLYSKSCIVQVPPQLHRAGVTPYLYALGTAWEGARFLGCRTGFISEKQILEGKLAGIKLLIIPAAKYLPPEITERVLAYVEQGGCALVVPESFLFDQYARPADKLAGLGLKVKDITLPPVLGEGELVKNYDQSFTQTLVFGEVKRKITTGGTDIFKNKAGLVLQSDGLVQTLDPGKNEVLAQFEDGGAAIVLVRLGKGTLYYLAAPLEIGDYQKLLEPLAEKVALKRPLVALDGQGSLITGAEVRAVERKDDFLVYASNMRGTEVEFNLARQDGKALGRVRDLRGFGTVKDGRVRLEPWQETIYSIPKDAAGPAQ